MFLTIRAIEQAKPRARPYKLFDEKGLYLRIGPSGTKAWRFKYVFAGRDKVIGLGRYPEVSLGEARAKRDYERKLVLEDKDPIIERRLRKQALVAAQKATFKRMAQIWLEENEPRWSKAHATRVKNRLEYDIYPEFGAFPVANIDGGMVLEALRKIEERGSIETAKRVRTYVHGVFKRAKGERLVTREILMDVDEIKDGLKPTPRGHRQPALINLSALLELQKCVDRSTAHAQTKLASRLLALTQVRIGVLRTALWEEFDGIDWGLPDEVCERPVWRIPAERMKLDVEDKGNEAFGHDVPLSSQSVEVLRALRILTGRCRYLFPHAKTWNEPMTDSAVSSLYKRMGGRKYKGRMVPHGWRTSFSTLMNERAAELERDGDRLIIDMILAHVPEGMSASEWAYNRARYFKPRAALLQIWADMITKGLHPPLELVVSNDDS